MGQTKAKQMTCWKKTGSIINFWESRRSC